MKLPLSLSHAHTNTHACTCMHRHGCDWQVWRSVCVCMCVCVCVCVCVFGEGEKRWIRWVTVWVGRNWLAVRYRKIKAISYVLCFFFFSVLSTRLASQMLKEHIWGSSECSMKPANLCRGRLPGILSRLPFQWVIITGELVSRQMLRALVHSAQHCIITNIFTTAVSTVVS